MKKRSKLADHLLVSSQTKKIFKKSSLDLPAPNFREIAVLNKPCSIFHQLKILKPI